MYELSQLQARVYFVIAKHGPIGPTNIGHHLEFAYEHASSSVTRPIRHLVKKGLIVKQSQNKRRVTYTTVHDTVPPLILTERVADEDAA